MRPQFDLVIRRGRIVDGSGGPPFVGDVAIRGGLIAEVGVVKGRGAEEIDARGLVVTPGFIDIHTHYDAQVTWTDRMAPSSAHGVTTVVTGNCGVGFAPCRAEDREALVKLMEGVEDIPEVVMAEGLSWDWTSFGDYLDAVERQPHDIDVAAQLPHSPLRLYVMGARALRREPATPDDMAQMARLATQAMTDGALGFSSSRALAHQTKAGEGAPSHGALEEELRTIALGVKAAGPRVLEFATDFAQSEGDVAEELGLLRRVADAADLPLSLSIALSNERPELGREIMSELSRARQQGVSLKLQVLGRAVGVHMGHELSLNPFMATPTYRALAVAPLAERLVRLSQPDVKAAILAEMDSQPASLMTRFAFQFPLGDPPDYEPRMQDSVAERARQAGQAPAAWAYDYLLEQDGKALLYSPLTNYAKGSLDEMLPLMRHDQSLLGLGDGGAHLGVICDAAFPTFILTHWVRDRSGERLNLAWAVQAMTSRNAIALGLRDRGLIRPGYKADLNVIDFDRLRLFKPTVVYDLPAGGRRMDQRADGYVATVVAGEVIAREGVATGASPGRLVRGPQPAPAAA